MAAAHPLVTPRFRNILVATDFSHESETAFKYAQALAKPHDSRVHALHVSGEYSYQVLEPDRLRGITVHANAELKRLFQTVPKQMSMRHGDVWEMINKAVERRHIDLLVMGTRARKGLERLIRGSVAEDVLRYAQCPVLTVGPGVKLGIAAPQIRSILLPTDFDPRADSPRYAAWLCNDFKAKLTVLHVSQEFPRRHAEVELAGAPGAAPDNLRAARALATVDRSAATALAQDPGVDTPMPGAGAKQLRSLMKETNLWCKPESFLEYGEPSVKILHIAAKIHPDLIVLGARFAEPEKLKPTLARSTITRVIAGAGCPVLTVKSKQI